MTIRTLSILILALAVTCCSDKPTDIRLSRVEKLASVSPNEALDSLEVIDYALLSDADKHYYDFLSVKVSDKAYISHTSDSLILKVIDYESNHQEIGRYPEALYYGGRVYSDMGDYPTALKYFQKALDIIDNTDNLHLQNRILSQTGRLLNSLRLYDKAIPYIQKAIQVDSILKDSVNYMYDMQLLGAINLHAKNFDSAEDCFNKSWHLANRISPQDTLLVKMYLAAIQYRKHNTDSALLLIRDVPEKIHPLSRNTALAYAAKIYLASEKLDSAYLYARQIIKTGNPNNRKTGYQILMSDQLWEFIPSDSIGYYLNDYSRILEDYFDQSQKESAVLQDSYYNYQVHVRERKMVENQKSQLIRFSYIITTVLLVSVIVILLLKYRNKSHLIKLREALDCIERLHKLLQSKDQKQLVNNSDLVIESNPHEDSIVKQDALELKDRLRQELLALSQTQQPRVSLKIIQSEAYAELQTYISKERFITDNNPLWNALESIVLEESVNFKEHLLLLTGGILKESTYHLAILLKCGVTPTQLTTLIGKTKGTISYQRAQLCAKVLGEKMGAKIIDDIIRLL